MPGGSSEERREAGLPRAEPSSRPQKRALADAEVMAMASPDEDAAAGVVTMGGDNAGSEWRSGDDCITLGDVEALIEQAQHDAEAAQGMAPSVAGGASQTTSLNSTKASQGSLSGVQAHSQNMRGAVQRAAP